MRAPENGGPYNCSIESLFTFVSDMEYLNHGDYTQIQPNRRIPETVDKYIKRKTRIGIV